MCRSISSGRTRRLDCELGGPESSLLMVGSALSFLKAGTGFGLSKAGFEGDMREPNPEVVLVENLAKPSVGVVGEDAGSAIAEPKANLVIEEPNPKAHGSCFAKPCSLGGVDASFAAAVVILTRAVCIVAGAFRGCGLPKPDISPRSEQLLKESVVAKADAEEVFPEFKGWETLTSITACGRTKTRATW
jgi:hypothetical protein